MTRFRSTLEHLRAYQGLYLLAVGLVIATWWVTDRRSTLMSEISSWPTTAALIASSEVTELPAPSDSDVRTRILINVQLRFHIDGALHEARVYRSLPGPRLVDYRSLLETGKEIQIRFDPKDPSRVSLAPLLHD